VEVEGWEGERIVLQMGTWSIEWRRSMWRRKLRTGGSVCMGEGEDSSVCPAI